MRTFHAEIERDLGEALRMRWRRNYSGALAVYQSMVERYPWDPRWHLKMGDVRALMGDDEGAVAQYLVAAEFYARNELWLRAARAARRALRIRGNCGIANWILGQALERFPRCEHRDSTAHVVNAG
jgi:tetratricopeptide (TPR) repeat protein